MRETTAGVEVNLADPTQMLVLVALTVDRALYCASCVTTDTSTVISFSLPQGEFAGSSVQVIGTASPSTTSGTTRGKSPLWQTSD